MGDVLRLFACTAVVCLAGCGPTPGGGAAAPAATGASPPTPGITIAVADTTTRGTPEQAVNGLVRLLTTERLVGVGRDGRPQPRIAERWDVSDDGLTWRFTLRRGLIFQDGEPITSAAVQRAIEPSDPAGPGYTPPGLRDVAAVEAPSPHEVVIRLRKPNTFLLDSLNLSPIASTTGSPAGPFRVDERPRGRAVLGRFKGFYRGRPALEGITVV
jgi:peptide/nickel transport system substrate-binding protein